MKCSTLVEGKKEYVFTVEKRDILLGSVGISPTTARYLGSSSGPPLVPMGLGLNPLGYVLGFKRENIRQMNVTPKQI
jgi:hypothetical protein